MGICPCVRDREHADCAPAIREQRPLLPVPGESTGHKFSEQTVTLRAVERIIRLVGPFTAHYHRLKLAKQQGRVELFFGEFVGSNHPCFITKIPKAIYSEPGRAKSSLFEKLKQLDHPHLLRTYEVSQDDECLYIVSEAYEGGELGKYFASVGRLSQSQAASAMYQLLSALAYCHKSGFAHGHVNMQTVVLKSHPVPEKLDLRLTDLHRIALDNQEPQQALFTPPEADRAENSEKSDVWACGVLLYLLLSGRSPFDTFTSPKLRYIGFTFPPSLWEGISSEAIRLILSMLKQRSVERPSAAECLNSPWLQRCHEISPRSLNESLSTLYLSPTRQPLKEAVMKFIIDRVMSDSELAGLSEAFSAVDSNGDGLISVEELKKCLEDVIKIPGSQEEAQRVLTKVDRNLNGMIDYSEFLLAAFREKKLLNEETLRLAFSTLDRDGNGRISVQELKHFFRLDHTPGSQEQWHDLIRKFDISGDGALDFREFHAMMTKAFIDESADTE